MKDAGGECGKLLETPQPLHTSRIDPLIPINRIHAGLYSFAILAIFYHRYLQLHSSITVVPFCLTLFLFFSDVVLAFMWLVTQAFRWRPIRRHPHPERLSNKDLPGLDVFICTADPYKEPPMGVVNTALSVMAYDYPVEKLSVYLSDDGGSDLTLFAFMEASLFAKHWVPFCKMNGIMTRCPEVYFDSNSAGNSHEENNIKKMYGKMREKIEQAMKNGIPVGERSGGLEKWVPGFTSKEHPTVVQILVESSKDMDITNHPLPNLIYVAREKTGAYSHHFKGGSLNTLLRVSGEITNAPFILNLDCDMKSNDPTTPHQAMCFLLDDSISRTLAFVQFPQRFSGINDGDIYGSEYKRQYLINPLGMNGITGPMYVGSNTFFNRRALHSSPDQKQTVVSSSSLFSDQVLGRVHQVAGASYEVGTKWGSTVGFRYGSLVEDFYTGYQLQCEGWESIFCDPERPAFLGEVPITLHDALSQTKRWIIGLLEIVFSEHCPVTYGVKYGSLLLGMCYSHNSFWSSWSIPLITYGILPQIALLHHNHPLFPNLLRDPWSLLYVYLFLASYGQDAIDFVRLGGGTYRKWWNNQRMWLVRGVTCYPAGIVEFSLNQFGLSPGDGFNVTSKVMDEDETRRYEKQVFDFGVASPFMVSVGVFAWMSLVGLVVGGVGSVRNGSVGEFGIQLLLCGFVVVNCIPVYAAMTIRKDGGRMPRTSLYLSLLITAAFQFLAYLTF